MVAAIGNGAAFSKGRDFGAWLGLVPKQMSTGDRTILRAASGSPGGDRPNICDQRLPTENRVERAKAAYAGTTGTLVLRNASVNCGASFR